MMQKNDELMTVNTAAAPPPAVPSVPVDLPPPAPVPSATVAEWKQPTLV
jgi:hypothetical protein